nr:MAG TPA: hypothetical protein [Caudoviricetes sp.]
MRLLFYSYYQNKKSGVGRNNPTRPTSLLQ